MMSKRNRRDLKSILNQFGNHANFLVPHAILQLLKCSWCLRFRFQRHFNETQIEQPLLGKSTTSFPVFCAFSHQMEKIKKKKTIFRCQRLS